MLRCPGLGSAGLARKAGKGCDFPCYDIYPVNDNKPLWYVPKGVDSLRSWSNDSKPVWTYIECTDISDGGGRKPTVKEIKCEIWQSIIHGANGILYFCHSFVGGTNEDAILDDAATTAGITEINSRITQLAAVINSPTVSGRVTCSASNVDIMVKQYQGDLFIFAAEMEGRTASPSFTVTSPPQTTAKVMDESRNLTISGGSFSDAFSIWGVHLYHIGDNWSAGVLDGFNRSLNLVPAIAVTCNPFRSNTEIIVTNTAGIPYPVISVYALDGRIVRSLGPVSNRTFWDGRDDAGRRLTPGVYFCRLAFGSSVASRSVLLLR